MTIMKSTISTTVTMYYMTIVMIVYYYYYRSYRYHLNSARIILITVSRMNINLSLATMTPTAMKPLETKLSRGESSHLP